MLEPRQIQAKDNYINPKSETFGNLKQSMIRAGFSEDYANTIAGREPAWLTANIEADVKMITQAEKNLRRFNDMEATPLKTKNDIEKAKLQIDVSKFIVKTLAKKKYGEHEEDRPSQVQINIVNYNEKSKPVEANAMEATDVQAEPAQSVEQATN